MLALACYAVAGGEAPERQVASPQRLGHRDPAVSARRLVCLDDAHTEVPRGSRPTTPDHAVHHRRWLKWLALRGSFALCRPHTSWDAH